jgi:predicted Zn-dependent peptidase
MWRRHPLGFSITGSKRALERLNLDIVKDYYRRWYVPSNILIAAAGHFDHDSLRELFEKHFGGLRGTDNQYIYQTPKVRAAKKLYSRRIGQEHITIGAPGVGADDPKRYAFNLLANILGGSTLSRLYQRVREEEGLVYQINTFLSSFRNTGQLGVYAALSPRQAQKAVDIILEELAKVKTEKVPDDELQSAKEQLKGNIVLALESTSGRMMRLARSVLALNQVESLKTIMQRIEDVTADEVRDLARELLREEVLNFVALGPLKDIKLRAL